MAKHRAMILKIEEQPMSYESDTPRYKIWFKVMKRGGDVREGVVWARDPLDAFIVAKGYIRGRGYRI